MQLTKELPKDMKQKLKVMEEINNLAGIVGDLNTPLSVTLI
jgi:hypothetical protein